MKIKYLLVAAVLALSFTLKASADTGPIILPAPSTNGGQTWYSGNSQSINWTVPYSSTSTNANISLVPYSSTSCPMNGTTVTCYGTSPYQIAAGVPNNGYYNGNVATDVTGRIIPSGQYLLNISGNGNQAFAATGTSSQIITVPSFTPTSNAPSNFSLSSNSGAPGSVVTLNGSGFPTYPNPSIQFGNGSYISATGNSNGSALQFTVPTYTQPCSSSLYPATITNNATTTTAAGTCPTTSNVITPGTYNITVSSNGNTYTIPFTVTQASTSPSGSIQMPNSSFANGSLIQVSGTPTIYLVTNGQYAPFNSADSFLNRGYQWSQVQTISPTQFDSSLLSSMPVMAQNGAAIKTATNPTVYLIINGQKSGIPSMTVFYRLGLSVANIQIVTDQELQNYPSAPDQM